MPDQLTRVMNAHIQTGRKVAPNVFVQNRTILPVFAKTTLLTGITYNAQRMSCVLDHSAVSLKWRAFAADYVTSAYKQICILANCVKNAPLHDLIYFHSQKAAHPS